MPPNTSKSNPTSEAEKEEIVRLREAGWSKRAISEKLGKSVGTVSHWCLVLGADSPCGISASGRTQEFMRDGRQVRPFTADEDRQLLEWAKAGLRHGVIAKSLGRSRTSISYRLLTLARQARLSEEAAQAGQKAFAMISDCVPKT
jgi:IS30 family transposase